MLGHRHSFSKLSDEEIKQNKQKYFDLAKEKYNANKHQKAIKILTRLVEIDPTWAVAYTYRLASYYQLNQYQQAIQDATHGIKLDRGYLGSFYSMRAYAYQSLGLQKEAEEDAELALKNGHDQDGAIFAYLARRELRNKNYENVINFATKSIACTSSKSVAAYLYLATAKFAMGNYDDALKDATSIASLNKSDHNDLTKNFVDQADQLIEKCKLIILARLKNDECKYHEVIDVINKLLILDDNIEEAYYLRARADFNTSKYDQCIIDATRGASFKGEYLFRCNRYQAYAYNQMGNLVEAAKAAENAAAKLNDGLLHFFIAKKKLGDKDYRAAVEEATKGINKDKDVWFDIYIVRAKAQIGLAEYEKAIEDAMTAVNLEQRSYAVSGIKPRNRLFISKAFKVAAEAAEKSGKKSDAFKYRSAACEQQKLAKPVPLTILCKYFIFANHGKLMVVAPSNFNGNFERAKAVMSKFDITPETIALSRQLQQLPTNIPDVFNKLDDEELRRSILHTHQQRHHR